MSCIYLFKSIFTARLLSPSTSLFKIVNGGYVNSDHPSSPNPTTDISSGHSIPLSLIVFIRYKVILFPPAIIAVGIYRLIAFCISKIQLSAPDSILMSEIFASFVLIPCSSNARRKPRVLSSLVVLFKLSLKTKYSYDHIVTDNQFP